MPDPPPDLNLDELLQHSGWVRALARALVSDAAAAEDVEQRTWLSIIEKPSGSIQTPRAWLGKVVRNFANMHRREQQSRERREEIAGERNSSLASTHAQLFQPDNLVEKMETTRFLTNALLDLEEPIRTVLYLRFFEELTVQETAKRAGVSASVARSRIERGLGDLRRKLKCSVGKDWRKLCLAVSSPSAVTHFSAIAHTLAMTLKTKLFLGSAAMLIAAIFLLTQKPDLFSDTPQDQVALAEETLTGQRKSEQAASTISRNNILNRENIPAAAELEPPEIQVVDFLGAPLAKAKYCYFTNSTITFSGTSTESGNIPRVSITDAEHLYVVANGVAPYKIPVKDLLDDVIRLPRGVVVSGTVLIDGVPSKEPLPIALRSNLPLRRGVPMEVLRELGMEQDLGVLKSESNDHGKFLFSALPTSWTGEVSYDGNLFLLEGSSRNSLLPAWVILNEPQEDIELRLLRAPTVSGRVVFPDSSLIQGKTQISCDLQWENSSEFNYGELEDDGTFSLAIRSERADPPKLIEVMLRVQGLPAHSWDIASCNSSLELGDLLYPDLRHLTLHVQDNSHRPILNATARPTGLQIEGPYSMESSDRGTITLGVPHQECSIEVISEDYSSRTISLPKGNSALQRTVVLTPATGVELVFLTQTGEAISSMQVQLDCEWNGPKVKDNLALAAHIVAGNPNALAILNSGRLLVTPNENGIIRVTEIKAGSFIKVQVWSNYDYELIEREIGPIVGDSIERHEISIERPVLVPMTAVFIDPDGTAVRPKIVTLSFLNETFGTQSQPRSIQCVDSVFSFVVANGVSFSLGIQDDRYAPSSKAARANIISNEPVKVQLVEAGRAIVTVLDMSDTPILASVVGLSDGAQFRSRALGAGEYEIEGFHPLSSLYVKVAIPGATFERECGLSRQVEFRLPALGKLKFDATEFSALYPGQPLRINFRNLETGNEFTSGFHGNGVTNQSFLPGRYQLTILAISNYEETELDWMANPIWLPVSDQVEIEILPGEVVNCHFNPTE